MSRSPLAPCLIGRGTLTRERDMLRALETIEAADYRYVVHGETVAEGQAVLAKLIADDESSTIAVNGCLFLNVASFDYLDFEQRDDGKWRFALRADSAVLELVTCPETDDPDAPELPARFAEDFEPSIEGLLALDEDDDED